jgi:4-hydroxybenzoate polyprenyltransferase
MEYVQALRPAMGIFSSLTCLAAIHLQAPTFAHDHPVKIAFLLIAVFSGASATMVYNDFVDREHDLKKGKHHAYDNQEKYIRLTHALLFVCGACCAWASGYDLLSWLPLGIIFLGSIGAYYSRTYPRKFLPMVTVGLVSASPVLFALLLPHPDHPLLGWILFFGIATTICAREILKDMEDADIDRGYKATIPAIWGLKVGQQTAGILLIIGSIAVLVASRNNLSLMSLTMMIGGVVVLLVRQPDKWGKRVIDVGTVCLVATLLLSS